MKRLLLPLAALAAALAGCNEPAPARILFVGHAPYYTKDAEGKPSVDKRHVEAHCPYCDTPIAWHTKKCPNKKCEGQILWKDAIDCGFCNGTGVCEVCSLNRITDFKCFVCRGKKYNELRQACPNCEGKGVCHLCGGSGKCDYCEGGKYKVDTEKPKGVVEPGQGDEAGAEKKAEPEKGGSGESEKKDDKKADDAAPKAGEEKKEGG